MKSGSLFGAVEWGGVLNTLAAVTAQGRKVLDAWDADIALVRSVGYAGWIERQVATHFGTRGWDWLNSQGYGDANNSNNYYDQSYPADYMVWNQLLASSDPMRKRMGLALSEFFVVSLSGLDFRWRSHAMAHYWDTLCA